MAIQLYYVHDPMCSWCYAFRPTWAKIREALPADLLVKRLVGGLAPDTDEPMPQAMRDYLQAAWLRITQVVPGTEFNFDFWTRCQPRRATFPACRAVIAARRQGEAHDEAMTQAIQNAYYREARNPSDGDTLIALAGELGLDQERFRADFESPEIQQQLLAEIGEARSIGADSFPSVVVVREGVPTIVAQDYNRAEVMLGRIRELVGL